MSDHLALELPFDGSRKTPRQVASDGELIAPAGPVWAEAGGRTLRSDRFAQEFLVDLNATQAAIRAGYSSRTASQIGYQLLQRTLVRGLIDELTDERSRRTTITQDMVVHELAALAFVDPRELFDGSGRSLSMNQIPDSVRRTISHLHVVENRVGQRIIRVRFWSKIRALELLGRHVGLFGGPCGTMSVAPGELGRRLREARRRVGSVVRVVGQEDMAEANCE